jgi:hypothetical protein
MPASRRIRALPRALSKVVLASTSIQRTGVENSFSSADFMSSDSAGTVFPGGPPVARIGSPVCRCKPCGVPHTVECSRVDRVRSEILGCLVRDAATQYNDRLGAAGLVELLRCRPGERLQERDVECRSGQDPHEHERCSDEVAGKHWTPPPQRDSDAGHQDQAARRQQYGREERDDVVGGHFGRASVVG